MPLRVLTWNLFHGRAVPESAALAAAPSSPRAIAGWEWDVALLQEVPPWWPPALGRAAGASARMALTSRNALLPHPARGRRAAPGPHEVRTAAAATRSSCAARRSREHRVQRLRALARATGRARRAARGRHVGREPPRAGRTSTSARRRDLDRAAAVTTFWAGGRADGARRRPERCTAPDAFRATATSAVITSTTCSAAACAPSARRAPCPTRALSDHAPVEIVVAPGR